jgi:hypothetical protein
MQLLLYKNTRYIFAINLILMVIFLMVLWKHGGDRVLNQPLKPMLLHKSDAVPSSAYMSYRHFHRKEHPDCRSVKFQQVTNDVYTCPCGVKFTYSTSTLSGYHEYKPAVKGSCVGCPAAKGAKDRVFRVSVHQDIYERMRKQRLSMRGKVLRSVRPSTMERSFAESKELHGLRFTRYRGVQQVQIQVWITAMIQNLKKWIKLRSLQQYGLYLTYQVEEKKKRKSSHSS